MRVLTIFTAASVAGGASATSWPFRDFLACYANERQARKEYRACYGSHGFSSPFNEFRYCFASQLGWQIECSGSRPSTSATSHQTSSSSSISRSSSSSVSRSSSSSVSRSSSSSISRSSSSSISFSSSFSYQSSSSSSVSSSTPSSIAPSAASVPNDYLDWRTYKANGVNLGAWLEKEKVHDPIWWDSVGGSSVDDEWSLCKLLGEQCGPIFEERYGSFLNTSTIDQLASVGVNTLKIPTTYAAWIKVPGSQLWSGNQKIWLKTITDYAITMYGMHCIIGLHSLPGGVNGLDIGEAIQHDGWFFNPTNLGYSYTAVEEVLAFIEASGYPQSFTLSPINEASDKLSQFGTSGGLSKTAADYVSGYIAGCIDRVVKVDKRIPIMLSISFKGPAYWDEHFDASVNLVLDFHVYYFDAAGTYTNKLGADICSEYQNVQGGSKFPTFVGEWSLQAASNNTYANRKTLFDTQRYAWQQHNISGSTFWTAVSYSTTPVDGEGTQRDYWSYVDLINAGVIQPETSDAYC